MLRTPLHLAVATLFRSPSPETIALLLKRGSDIAAADQAGDTPLHLAAKHSEPWHQPPAIEIITLLLAQGANITADNNDGDTACDIARVDDEAMRAVLCP